MRSLLVGWVLASAAVSEVAPGPDRPATESETVLEHARNFFSNLLAARVQAVVQESELPFYLEGRKINSAEELSREWTRNLANKRTDLLTLYGIEVLTPAEMEKKYGKPPARLSAFPWKNATTYIAVANLSGRAAIALLHRGRAGWRVVGYHD